MTTKNSQTPELVTHDFSVDKTSPLPSTLTPVGKLVHWNGTPNFQEVSVLLDPNHEVKPGQFLGIWHGRRDSNRVTVIQVKNCSEVNPNEDPTLSVARDRLGLSSGYASEGVSTRIFRISHCDTVEEFEVVEKAKKWSVVKAHAPEALARAGDPVVILPEELGYEVIGSLQDPLMGLNLGETYGPNPTPVNINPTALQLHMGIFGNPGKGKSYFSGIVIEEAVAWDVPTLVLDVNGETVAAAESLGGEIITLPNKNKFGLSLDLITPSELLSIIPNVQPGTQYADLIEASHDQLRNESKGKSFSFEALKARIAQNGEATKLVKNSVNVAISRLSVLENDPLIGENFDFIGTLKKKRLVVLDCRFLSLRQTRLIAAAAARSLQAYGRAQARLAEEKNDKEAAKWFSILFIDEAHAIVPNDEDVVSTQVLYELARMGRHVRTGLILSSQSPADLDTSVLKRLQMRFVFSLEKDQLRSVGGIVSDLSEEILNQLPKLPRGVCAVSGSSEIIRHGFLLQVKARSTPVGGSTPKVFDSRKKKARK